MGKRNAAIRATTAASDGLADLQAYLEADKRLVELYADSEAWAHKAILNVAGSGKFSSDRTIAQYAAEIWNVKPCPVS